MNDLKERLKGLSPEKRALLQSMLAKKSKAAAITTIEKRSKNKEAKLSFAQQRLWFLEQMEQNISLYNLQAMLRLRGNIDPELLERSFLLIIERHEVLRTCFKSDSNGPFQYISDHIELPFLHKSMEKLPESEKLGQVFELAAKEAQYPFDLEKGPLLRIMLIKLAPGDHVFVLTLHHIITDAWSVGIMIREITMVYEAFSKGMPSPLAPLKIQYADFACWQHEYLKGVLLEKQLDYWKNQLAGVPRILKLPLDRPRPSEKTFPRGVVRFFIDTDLTARLNRISRKSEATLFMTLLAVFSILMARYSGQKDILIGSPVANRHIKSVEPLTGFFVNTLVFRTKLDGNPKFTNVLEQVKKNAAEAYSNQDIPFEHLVEILQPGRSLSHTPLFQVMFVLQNAPVDNIDMPGLRVDVLEAEPVAAIFDITLSMTETKTGIKGMFEYNTDLFDEETLSNMATHFETLLESVSKDCDQPIFNLPMLTENEKKHIIENLNDTDAQYPHNMTISDLFCEQAEQKPDKTAVIYGNNKTTYRELNIQADRLARYIKETCKTENEEFIAVILNRSDKVISTFLGILKAGAAYVPIDSTYPEDRISYILADSGCRVIVTESEYADTLAASQVERMRKQGNKTNFQIVNIDTLPSFPETVGYETGQYETGRYETGQYKTRPDNAAYVIYTSGSTGLPKGCVISHRNVVRLMKNDRYRFEFGPDDVWVTAHSFCFDFSVWEMYGALLYGGHVVVAAQEDVRDPHRFLNLIRTHKVSVLNQTPGAFYNLIEAELDLNCHNLDDHLRYVIFGGDRLDPGYLRKWADTYPLEKIRLVNMYGITETTVHVTFCQLSKAEVFGEYGKSPIGVPLPETRVYVCDDYMNLQPTGVPGEMYVGGTGVSSGYLNRLELTSQKFIKSEFRTDEKLYRTGDTGKWLKTGVLEFLGRNDDQVQIRGYRVEPGEIENSLISHEFVEKAVVIAKEGREQNMHLVAYLTFTDKSEQGPGIDTLREYLKKTLPDYMIPAYFVCLVKFPLTSNNKVDKKALPDPLLETMNSGVEFITARNQPEADIIKVWSKVLGIKKIGILDNYFALGGDSIKAIRTVSKLLKKGWKMEIRDLFKYSTPKELGPHLLPVGKIDEYKRPWGIVPITAIQQWFFETIHPDSNHFNLPIILEGLPDFDADILEQALNAVCKHHDTLRLRFFSQNGQIIQKYTEKPEAFHFEVLNFENEDGILKMKSHADKLHGSMNLENGPLIKTALYRIKDKKELLLITAHHLVIDVYSWKIFLEDLNHAYGQIIRKKSVQLIRTASFKQWAEKICEYCKTDKLLSQISLWRNIVTADVKPLPSDMNRASDKNRADINQEKCLVADTDYESTELSEKHTELLTTIVQKTFNTGMDEFIIAALAKSLKNWTGNNIQRLFLVGHGREKLFDDLDISRTVGWFTTLYPVLLTLPQEEDIELLTAHIKNTLKKAPDNGIGYGILRYVAKDQVLCDNTIPSEIVYSNLGHLDGEIKTDFFTVTLDSSGNPVSTFQKRPHFLEVVTMIADNRLRLRINYSSRRFYKKTIETFLTDFKNMLEIIIQHCI
ncbi:amino acid adenylation domain-containing protein [Desulfobacterales bacterium HSG16]|nr:amino acid adenylation domain-containing protein [Desulfobacterales bacterium HSG16]